MLEQGAGDIVSLIDLYGLPFDGSVKRQRKITMQTECIAMADKTADFIGGESVGQDNTTSIHVRTEVAVRMDDSRL